MKLIKIESLPAHYATRDLPPEFWEALGRAIGAFGFLEDTLKRALFHLSGTLPVEGDADEAVKIWGKSLQSWLVSPLQSLVSEFLKAAKSDPRAPDGLADEIAEGLSGLASLRNLLVHATWTRAGEAGRPTFFRRGVAGPEVAGSTVSARELVQIEKAVTELTCEVINFVQRCGVDMMGQQEVQAPQ